MDTESILNNILSEVKKLNREEQLILVGKITNMIDEVNAVSKSVSLSQLSGLGADIWLGIDIDKYLDDEWGW